MSYGSDASALCYLGVAGLGVMGQNLALNFAEKGFRTAVFNRTASKVDSCVERAKQEGITQLFGYKNLKDFCKALSRPRKIIVLIQAGAPVDAFLETLIPFLEKGDIVVDAGNEWYETTQCRMEKMKQHGLQFLGMGVSGGEEGARRGPALMAGGTPESYSVLETMLKKVAAQSSAGPCVALMGPGGAGNYVKMVHNGIEYGDMQLIAEAYELLRRLGNLSNQDMHQTFSAWNQGRLESFLMRITASVFAKKDDLGSDGYLLDKIKDAAGSKGTGMWTVREAAKRSVPCPTLGAALMVRHLSAFGDLRQEAAKAYATPCASQRGKVDATQLKEDIEKALYCAKISLYAQGMMLLKAASDEEQWGLTLSDVVKTWMAGSILEARFLQRLKSAYDHNPQLRLLLLDHSLLDDVRSGLGAWRRVVSTAVGEGVAIPALLASLEYFDTITCNKLPVNLVAAQRDLFGAHGYYRLDRQDGPFHTNWAAQ